MGGCCFWLQSAFFGTWKGTDSKTPEARGPGKDHERPWGPTFLVFFWLLGLIPPPKKKRSLDLVIWARSLEKRSVTVWIMAQEQDGAQEPAGARRRRKGEGTSDIKLSLPSSTACREGACCN